MSKTVSVRVAHLSAGKTKGQRYHDTRHGHVPGYVDRTRTADNSALIEPPSEAALRAMCEERRAQRPIKRRMRSDAAIMTSGIITFGKDAKPIIEAMSREQQDALYRETAEAFAKEWLTDVVSLTVHRDESAPHAHFGLLAVDRDGKPLAKTLDTRRMQDMAGQVFERHGITRGTPKAERIARGDDIAQVVHRSVRELHRDLPKELDETRRRIERERQELEARAEKNRRLIAEQEAKLAAGRVSEEQARKRMEAYERRAAEAEQKAAALARQMAEQGKTLSGMQTTEASIRRAAEAWCDGLITLVGNTAAVRNKLVEMVRQMMTAGDPSRTTAADDLTAAAIAFRDEAPSVRREMERAAPQVDRAVDRTADLAAKEQKRRQGPEIG